MRFKEWFLLCMSMCLCSLVFAASAAAALFVSPPFVSDCVFGRKNSKKEGERKMEAEISLAE